MMLSVPYIQDRKIPELIHRSLEGDTQAFRSLLELEHEYVYFLATRILRDEQDACDVVQEAFIRVWNNLDRYKPEVKFTTWLYKIVVNLCYDRIKMESRRRKMFSSMDALREKEGQDIADGNDPGSAFDRHELRDRIVAAAGDLPPMERLVFHLRDIMDMTVSEVAEVVGISDSSVKTNLCYARKRIRNVVNAMQKERV